MIRLLFFALCLLIAPFLSIHGHAQTFALVDRLNHDLTIHLNPDSRSLKVTDRMTFEGEGLLRVKLSSKLQITELRLDDRKVPAMAKPGEMLVRLSGGRKTYELQLEYTGQLPGLPADTQAAAAPIFFAAPTGSYLPGASGWIADLGKEFFTYTATVYTPPLHKGIVPGRLVEEATDAKSYKAVYQNSRPSDEIPLFAGPYKVEEKQHKGLRLRTYFFPGMEKLADDYLAKTADYIDFYSQWIGPYPFDGFSIVASPLPVGFGYPGLTYMGAHVLRLPFIKHTSLGHEVLHNWWGNGVFVDYESGNWAEGLTTFMADYTYALQKGPDSAKEKRLSWLRDYAALPQERDAPPKSFKGKLHTASQVVGYNKVAFFFHMLRNELGEDVFDRSIRLFWKNNSFQRASWNDLQAAFEQTAGRKLNDFFAQWLERKGAPSLSLIAAHREDRGVIVTLQQTPPVYDLFLPIVVEMADGKTQKTFYRFASQNTTIRISTPSVADNISIDPDYDLFRHLADGETPPILRDVTLSENTLVVIPDDDPTTKETARRLAVRMMDVSPQIVTEENGLAGQAPRLIIGTDAAVTSFLSKSGLGGPPTGIAEVGTARVWAGRSASDLIPFVVVAAQNKEALAALLRPLPHYGRQGLLAFDGSKVIRKGTLPPDTTPLRSFFATNQ